MGVIDVGGKYKYVVHLAYDVQTGKFTILKIEKEKGLKSQRREMWTQACNNCGSSMAHQYDWYDYMTFNVTLVNQPANDKGVYVFSGLQDRTIGSAKVTTDNNWETLARFKSTDDRGGIMWTTEEGDGSWGAGVWGDPDAIENIDAFNKLKEQWDKNAPPYTNKIIDQAQKLVKTIDKIDGQEPPSGWTDANNKAKDNFQEVLDATNKIAPSQTSSNNDPSTGGRKPKPVRDTIYSGPHGVVRDPNSGVVTQYSTSRTEKIQGKNGTRDTLRTTKYETPKN